MDILSSLRSSGSHLIDKIRQVGQDIGEHIPAVQQYARAQGQGISMSEAGEQMGGFSPFGGSRLANAGETIQDELKYRGEGMAPQEARTKAVLNQTGAAILGTINLEAGAIPAELKPIAQEALKYKSAEEWADALTPKKFREVLNAFDRLERNNVAGDLKNPYRNSIYGQRKRLIGDYLYAQDRDMFNDKLRRTMLKSEDSDFIILTDLYESMKTTQKLPQ
jgi:hypothetical protein